MSLPVWRLLILLVALVGRPASAQIVNVQPLVAGEGTDGLSGAIEGAAAEMPHDPWDAKTLGKETLVPPALRSGTRLRVSVRDAIGRTTHARAMVPPREEDGGNVVSFTPENVWHTAWASQRDTVTRWTW